MNGPSAAATAPKEARRANARLGMSAFGGRADIAIISALKLLTATSALM